MRKRSISKKNYILCAIIFILTITICLMIFFIMENNKKYNSKIPILRGTASEIEPKDLDNYLIENPDVLLYIGVADDFNSRKVEEKFKKIIEENDLNVIYLNLTNLTKKEIKEYLSDFSSKYSSSKNVNNYPAFLIVFNRKVVDFVQKESRDLDISDISHILDMYEIKGEKND